MFIEVLKVKMGLCKIKKIKNYPESTALERILKRH